MKLSDLHFDDPIRKKNTSNKDQYSHFRQYNGDDDIQFFVGAVLHGVLVDILSSLYFCWHCVVSFLSTYDYCPPPFIIEIYLYIEKKCDRLKANKIVTFKCLSVTQIFCNILPNPDSVFISFKEFTETVPLKTFGFITYSKTTKLYQWNLQQK